jgi:protein-tyrosine-phosphatase
MAEAIARGIASDIIEPSSAGFYPLGRLAEATEQTLLASGYPVAGLSSKPLRRDALEDADLIINMSGRPLDELFDDGTPARDPLLAQKVENWDVEDPYGEEPAIYQRILEDLESRVLLLANRLRAGQRAADS